MSETASLVKILKDIDVRLDVQRHMIDALAITLLKLAPIPLAAFSDFRQEALDLRAAVSRARGVMGEQSNALLEQWLAEVEQAVAKP